MDGGHSIRRTWLAILLFLVALKGGRDLNCAAHQYQQPLGIYADGNECALVLNGRGRTSVFDYTYNLLRGAFSSSSGSQTCITYDAVNRAYLEARKRINVVRPDSEKPKPEDLASVGELLLDISINLARTYGLTREEIEKSLPLIDTSKTLINEVCPAYLSNVECRPGKYRRYDGLCTNLENPTWGATLTPFTRLLEPNFADGITAPRISVTGNELPLSRVVSRTMHPDEGYHDHAGTVMVIAWGQFMDHDYTLTGTPLDPLNRNDPEECCSLPPHLKNPYCNEILIPEDDYFYRLFNVRCMDFVRAFPAVRPGCRLGSRVPFNLLTGVLDGNTVYGVTETFAKKLRTGYGGLLRMNPVFSEYGLKDLLPLKLDIPDEGCTRPNRSMYCFEAGEIRVNEQLVLTCMHTLLAREHNRIAKALTQVNPHWDDETLFQEARRIVIAQIQHVTYNEFLPILLGKDVMEKFGLLLEKNDYWDGYDSSINPGVIDAFASAAFRFGHSLLPTAVERWSKAHKFIASKRLSDLIRRPYDLYRAGVLDEYFMGLMNQVAQAMDDSITQEVTNHLFKKVGAKFGMDLVSFNMQRGREFGIPSYMEFRKFCGLPGADTFEELFGSMPNETISRYSSIFEHPSDVDLWSGGVSERPLPGSMLGPTFACVIATQFSYSRRGDRFWYELPNQPSSFTLEQLNEVRKTSLAKLICDNTDLIDTIQLYPMVLPDHEINPRVPCRSGIFPNIDFSKWAEFPTGHATQYNIIVEESVVQVKRVEAPPTLTHARFLQPNWMSILKGDRTREHKPMILTPQRNKFLMKYRQKLKQSRRPDSTSIINFLQSPRNKVHNEFNPTPDRQALIPSWLRRFEVNIASKPAAQRNNDPSDIVQITTIIETIRRRNKRNADLVNASTTKGPKAVNSGRKTNKDKPEFFKVPSNGRRTRRAKRDAAVTSTDQRARSIPKKLYRHPRLSAEDQKNTNKTTNRIQGSATTARNYTDYTNNAARTRRLQKINGSGRRPSYTPVIKECNHTAASEIADLNIPPPSSKYVRSKRPIIIPDIDFPRTDVNKEDPTNQSQGANEENEDSKESRNTPNELESTSMSNDESPSSVSTEPRSGVKNETYVNLQDHQRAAEVLNVPKDRNGYPVDIPPYNPDKIPYVDVPDINEQRDESLDKDDRRAANDKLEDYGNKDAIAVDPEAPLNGYERPKAAGQRSRDEEKDDEQEVSSYKEDDNSSHDKDVNESRREEEENAEDENRAREKPYDVVVEKSEDKAGKGDEGEEQEDENVEEQSQEAKKPEETFDFEPVHFDINDYIKPFDLDDLYKVEPTSESEKLKREKTEGNRENDGNDNDKEYDDDEYYKRYYFDASNHEDQIDRDYPKSPVLEHFNNQFQNLFGNVSFAHPTFEHYAGEESKKLRIVNDDEFRYGDKDFFRPIYETRGKLFRYNNDGSDYYSRYYDDDDDDDDAAYKFRKPNEDEDEKEEVEDEGTSETKIDKLLNEEAHKTLSSILEKKDDISRINDEVNKKVKEDGEMPQQYKNYWSLEYGTNVNNKTNEPNATNS